MQERVSVWYVLIYCVIVELGEEDRVFFPAAPLRHWERRESEAGARMPTSRYSRTAPPPLLSVLCWLELMVLGCRSIVCLPVSSNLN